MNQCYNLASERVRAGLTQEQLCSELGCSLKTLGKWEKDATTMPGTAIKHASAFFGCSVDYLLGNSEERLLRTS